RVGGVEAAKEQGYSPEDRESFADDLISPLAGDSRLLALSRHIQKDLSEPLPSWKAARIVGLERRYFSRFFRKETGYNFSWWNREIRMRLAKELLQQRKVSIHSVALAVGYCDLTTFERAFKRSTGGIGPREYRATSRYGQGSSAADESSD